MCGCTPASCVVRLHLRKLRCTVPSCLRIHFGWNLRWYIFRLVKCNRNFEHFFINIGRNDDWNYLSFGVNYVSVAQKLKILPILLNFRKIKAEILSFKMRCYVYKIKLKAEGFWVAELRVRQVKIGRKSCFGN